MELRYAPNGAEEYSMAGEFSVRYRWLRAPDLSLPQLAGDLRGSVLRCPARFSSACNGRPANLLKLQRFIPLSQTENHGVGRSIPPLGTKYI